MDAPDSDRFDIFFAGECLDGFEAGAVRAALATLFRADDRTLDRLFSGKRQRIKAGVDAATAKRYQVAMGEAGARAVVLRVAAASADSAAPDTDTAQGSLTLAPVGSDVLRPGERRPVAASPPPTEHLSVADAGEDLAPPRSPAQAPLAAPDFEVASLGSDLAEPPMASSPPPVPGSLSLSLAAPEHDLSDCARRPESGPPPQTEHLALALPGSDLLTAGERARPEPVPPRTDHLHLDDDTESP
jgi:hypothetical protein